MTTEAQPRIALLIDADNAPAEMIDEILTELSTYGVINIRRAYGNWTKSGLNGWQSKLLEFALRPMQQFDYSRRKNATDMAMTVDAMELLYTERPDAFGIVSSDADFTPLVMHLRAKGAAVYGFGMAQTPKPFVNACSRFLYLEALAANASESTAEGDSTRMADTARSAKVPNGETAAPAPEATPPEASRTETEARTDAADHVLAGEAVFQRGVPLRIPPSQLRQDRRLVQTLRDAVYAVQDEQGWAKVGAVGTHLGNKLSFDARNYGYASLSKLLAAIGLFELRDEATPKVAVRVRSAQGTASPRQPTGNGQP